MKPESEKEFQAEIEIPCLPDRRLSPNKSRKQHWGAEKKAKTELQTATFGACLAFKQEYRNRTGECWKPLDRATLSIKIVNGVRRMDRDNTIACMKFAIDVLQCPAVDGLLRGSIIVNDSRLSFGTVEWVREKGRRPATLFILFRR